MAKHVRVTCPHCERSNLRMRPEYIGQMVRCHHCKHTFLAQSADVLAPDTTPEEVSAAQMAASRARVTELEDEIQWVRTALVTRADEHATALQQLQEAQGQLAQMRTRM